MEKFASVTHINTYRIQKDTQPSPETKSASRYSSEEQALIDQLNHPHPAGRALIEREINKDPTFVTRIIEDKLVENGYSETVVAAVDPFRQHLEDNDFTAEETSKELRLFYQEMLTITAAENDRRSNEAIEQQRRGKVVLSAIEGEGRSERSSDNSHLHVVRD